VLTALLLLTFFAGGQFNPKRPAMLAGAAIAICLLLAELAGWAWIWKRSEDRRELLACCAQRSHESPLP
jgi:hypothetical protein